MSHGHASRALQFISTGAPLFTRKSTSMSTRCLFLFSPGSFSWLSFPAIVLYTEVMVSYGTVVVLPVSVAHVGKSSRT
jgi:hypothetical protein